MDKFIYLKLGQGNCLAEYWLSEDNVFKTPVAAIYFGTNTDKDIREYVDLYDNKGGKEEAKKKFKEKLGLEEKKKRKPDIGAAMDFVKAPNNSGKTNLITITDKKVYIYKPEGQVFTMGEDEYEKYDNDLSKLSEGKNIDTLTKGNIENGKVRPERSTKIKHIPKIMPVKDVKKFKIKEVPHVLASLPCNQYLTWGTCRKIDPKKNWGAIQAIYYCSNGQIDKQPKCAHELMNFLSSYELETLVFLILTNAGLFVPAWRGGTQKGFDLIAHKFTNSAIKKLQIPTIESKDGSESSFTFQVKKGKVEKHSEFADFTIATEYDGDDNRILNANWLLENIRKQWDTRVWFGDLLYWISDIDSKIDKINYRPRLTQMIRINTVKLK